jgi:hypothetical protein
MSSTAQLREQWKEANAEVRVAEEKLAAAWTAFAEGRAGAPDKELLTEVARLRRECDHKLAAVLDQFGKPSARTRGGSERPSC